jgi:hypothetical protein
MQLTEALLAKIAGWDAMKRARGLVAANQVSGSNWTPPTLRGLVHSGTVNYRAGLVIQSTVEVENLCSCRESRERGLLCAHSIAIGLHYLQGLQAPVESRSGRENFTSNQKTAGGQGAASRDLGDTRELAPAVEGPGETLELFVILPPNLETAIAKDRILVCMEGVWRGRRQSLSAIPLTSPLRLAPSDRSVLEYLQSLTRGEAPGLVQLNASQLAQLLGRLVGHPRVSLGKSQSVTVTQTPFKPELQATLQPSGEIEVRLAPGDSGRAFCMVSEIQSVSTQEAAQARTPSQRCNYRRCWGRYSPNRSGSNATGFRCS